MVDCPGASIEVARRSTVDCPRASIVGGRCLHAVSVVDCPGASIAGTAPTHSPRKHATVFLQRHALPHVDRLRGEPARTVMHAFV